MPVNPISTRRASAGPILLERLKWPLEIHLDSYGVKLRVRSTDEKILDLLPDLLPPGWKTITASEVERTYSIVVRDAAALNGAGKMRSLNLVYADDELVARSRKTYTALERFEADLQLFVAESAARQVFIHSGVVRWRGKAILIPGRSFSGKTTLVAELVRAGAVYYSDEYAVLDSNGRVHPFPKPLAIRKDGSTDQTKFAVESFGGNCGVRSAPVGLIVVSQYKPGAAWRPRLLSTGKSVLELLSNAVPARKRPAAALDVLQKVASAASTLKGIRGDGAETARLILRRLDETL